MDNGGNDPRKMTDEEFEAELLRQLGDSLAHERDEQVRKGPLEIAPTLLLSAYLTFCMLVFAFGANAAVSGAFLLVSAVLVSATVRSPIQILLLALPVFLLVSGTGSLSFGAYLAALWLGAGYAAFLFRTARPFMVLPFVAAVPVAAFLLGASVPDVLCTLLPALIGAVLFLALRAGMTKTQAVCTATAAFLALFVGLLLFLGLRTYGTAFFDRLPEIVDNVRTSAGDRLAESFTAAGGKISLTAAQWQAMAASVFNILPAIVLLFFMLCAFLSDTLALALLRSFGREKKYAHRIYAFSLSTEAALLFLLSYIGAHLLAYSSKSEMAAVVLENLYLLLLPGTVYAGVTRLLHMFIMSNHRFLWFVGVLVLLFISPSLLLICLAFMGALTVLVFTFRRFLHRSGRDGDSSGGV